MAMDGGPAYPAKIVKKNIRGEKRIERYSGMSLRDWFAGQALAMMNAPLDKTETIAKRAEVAFKYADAMLAEREKQ